MKLALAFLFCASASFSACTSSGARPTASFCTLQGEELEQRKIWVRRLVREHCNGLRERADGFVLRFRDEARVHDELEQLVANEQQCCASIGWSLDRGPDRTVLLLSVVCTPELRDELLGLLAGPWRDLPRF